MNFWLLLFQCLFFASSHLSEFCIKMQILTLQVGFEPTRGDPIGFQVQRLNHSAIAALLNSFWKAEWTKTQCCATWIHLGHVWTHLDTEDTDSCFERRIHSKPHRAKSSTDCSVIFVDWCFHWLPVWLSLSSPESHSSWKSLLWGVERRSSGKWQAIQLPSLNILTFIRLPKGFGWYRHVVTKTTGTDWPNMKTCWLWQSSTNSSWSFWRGTESLLLLQTAVMSWGRLERPLRLSP